jgi:NAD+ synthase
VEDFGVGFFTKYGDGGVDISPIGDCLKTEVCAMAEELKILPSIISAPPTDGLWDDGRTDEDQLGMTYPALEESMRLDENNEQPQSKEQAANLKRYRSIRARNLHKMNPIPVCQIPKT